MGLPFESMRGRRPRMHRQRETGEVNMRNRILRLPMLLAALVAAAAVIAGCGGTTTPQTVLQRRTPLTERSCSR